MRREVLRFWLAAAGVASVWTVLTSILLPYQALGLVSGAERSHAWLLTLWTSGVLAICFGSAGLIGHLTPLGFREVAEAGSLTQAIEDRRRSRRQGGNFHSNFAWWLIVTGGLIILIYFGVWGFAYA